MSDFHAHPSKIAHRDGASRTTRRELLAAVTTTKQPPPGDDAGWLARLAQVELLSLYCYDHVLAGGVELTAAERAALTHLRGHERAHVAALLEALRVRGGHLPAGPTSPADANRDLARRDVSGRLGQLQGAHDAFNLLLALERVVVGAYYIALTGVAHPALSGRLAQMMACDGQHEAILHEQMHPGDIVGAIPYGLVQGIQ